MALKTLPWLSSLRRSVVVVFFLGLLAYPALSDVVVKPTFGHPYIFADRIVFTSVDGTHLIAIDKKGHLQWELTFPDRIFVQHIDQTLTVQSEQHVYKVSLADGKKTELFVMPENELLLADFGNDFLATTDRRFDRNRLRVINPVDYSTAWESTSIEEIIAVTESTVVASTAERVYESDHHGYHLENLILRGFDRQSGRIRWSIPLANGLAASAHVANFLAVVYRLRSYQFDDGSEKLSVLDPDTGAILSQRQGEFGDLWPLEDSVGVLEISHGAEKADFYICKLPECRKNSVVSLSAKEILRVRVYRDYIITAGIYDAACFDRATGRRLWEKGQLEWSEPFDNEMVITDFSSQDQTARIVSIDLSTGREQPLFSRTVTDHDKANFQPW